MKNFLKKAKDTLTVAGNSLGDNAIKDEEEIVNMNNREKELQQRVSALVSQIQIFHASAKVYFSQQNDVFKKYTTSFDDGSSEKSLADSAAKCSASVAEVGNTFASYRLQKYVVDPLVAYGKQISKTLSLGNERHSALVLMKKNDEDLQALKDKKADQAKITDKQEKNNQRHEEFNKADKAFRDAYAKDQEDAVIIKKSFDCFTFYIEEINKETLTRFNEVFTEFNMASHASEFKSITDNTPE